ncbi:hypothetical protein [Streptomyces europaeiscabiei]|uniref:hypothetical protein n=1 Tax=Streptomyces europaeiscabiei TaxID=146819 RepID=UPI002E198A88
MASVALDTAALEVLVESVINNKRSGMELLNTLRVANGKPAHPANFGPGDLNNVHDSDWRTALRTVRSALEA